MPKLLFVNACVRGREDSRTDKLCRAFIDEFLAYHAGWSMEELFLPDLGLAPFNVQMLEQRNRQVEQGVLDQPAFNLAWQFAGASKIVVGAPYWDLSFPAVLKIYVEHISVAGVTFRYNDDWLEGICAADSLMYITTAGGSLEGADLGYDFIRALCRQFGIANCNEITAEGLDIIGADVPVLLSQAAETARQLARSF